MPYFAHQCFLGFIITVYYWNPDAMLPVFLKFFRVHKKNHAIFFKSANWDLYLGISSGLLGNFIKKSIIQYSLLMKILTLFWPFWANFFDNFAIFLESFNEIWVFVGFLRKIKFQTKCYIFRISTSKSIS